MSILGRMIARWPALAALLLVWTIVPARAAPPSELFDPGANVVLGRLKLGASIDQVAQSLNGLVLPKQPDDPRARSWCRMVPSRCLDPDVPLSATDLAKSMRESAQLDCAAANCKIPHDPLIVFNKLGTLSLVRIQFGTLSAEANTQAQDSYEARYGKPYLPSQEAREDFASGRVRHVVIPYGDGRVTLVCDMNVFGGVFTSVEYRDPETATAWVQSVKQQRAGANNPLLQ